MSTISLGVEEAYLVLYKQERRGSPESDSSTIYLGVEEASLTYISRSIREAPKRTFQFLPNVLFLNSSHLNQSLHLQQWYHGGHKGTVEGDPPDWNGVHRLANY